MGRYIASSGGNVKASGEIREPFCVFEEIKRILPIRLPACPVECGFMDSATARGRDV